MAWTHIAAIKFYRIFLDFEKSALDAFEINRIEKNERNKKEAGQAFILRPMLLKLSINYFL